MRCSPCLPPHPQPSSSQIFVHASRILPSPRPPLKNKKCMNEVNCLCKSISVLYLLLLCIGCVMCVHGVDDRALVHLALAMDLRQQGARQTKPRPIKVDVPWDKYSHFQVLFCMVIVIFGVKSSSLLLFPLFSILKYSLMFVWPPNIPQLE